MNLDILPGCSFLGELVEPLLISCDHQEDYWNWIFQLQQVKCAVRGFHGASNNDQQEQTAVTMVSFHRIVRSLSCSFERLKVINV